jgi:hypothetical protein
LFAHPRTLPVVEFPGDREDDYLHPVVRFDGGLGVCADVVATHSAAADWWRAVAAAARQAAQWHTRRAGAGPGPRRPEPRPGKIPGSSLV